jgi:hypothetical protein
MQVQFILLYRFHIIQTKDSHKVVISYKYIYPLHTVDKLYYPFKLYKDTKTVMNIMACF